ncbi:MAG: chorismate synthase, partial [Bacteroidota bacterium]
GAIAMQLLACFNVEVFAWTSAIGPIEIPANVAHDLESRYRNEVRTSHAPSAEAMKAHISKIKAAGDSCGGIISGLIRGLPAGVGEPVFSKLPAELAKAMMGINAAKGFELGSGFSGTLMQGSEHNDPMVQNHTNNQNHAGGTNGGISNGNDITFRVAFKPVSTISKTQMTLDKAGNQVELSHEGRHDPCVVPRAVPIVESMAALVIADQLLLHRSSRI